MIRGGHIDLCALGAFQVSGKGDIANLILPGRKLGNIGGGMDLVARAKKVIVVMTHTTKDDKPKIVNECTYELTGEKCVSLIITDIAVIEITTEGTILKEMAPGWTGEEIQKLTEPRLLIAPDIKEIEL
jgi:3-oxoacid CoA-transferase subunit B